MTTFSSLVPKVNNYGNMQDQFEPSENLGPKELWCKDNCGQKPTLIKLNCPKPKQYIQISVLYQDLRPGYSTESLVR